MDVTTMCRAYPGLATNRAQQLLDGCNQALRLAACTTVQRAAMFIGQTGEESGSLRYPEEIASGAEYEGRRDLGNTQQGDGVRFKGRGFIMVTGRTNYTQCSQWAHGKGLVATATYFVDHPAQLASDACVWLGPVWYWTVARNMNSYADAGDIQGATRAVNGGLNGLADRTSRWRAALELGSAILPTAASTSGGTSGRPTLRQGSTGHYVGIVQDRLNLTPAETPTYGPVTVSAVRMYQKRHKISVDGIVGDSTWSRLSTAKILPGERVVNPGDTGPDVGWLQRRIGLEPASHPAYGPITGRAVLAWKHKRGLGGGATVGPITWHALGADG